MSDGVIGSCGKRGRGGVTGSVIMRVLEVPDTGAAAGAHGKWQAEMWLRKEDQSAGFEHHSR